MRVGVLMLIAVLATSARIGAQSAAPADGPGLLVERLEGAIAREDELAARTLLSPAMAPADANAFVSRMLVSGATRVVVRERDRSPLPDVPADDGFQLLIEILIERGRVAGVYSMRLEIRRIPGSDPPTPEEPGWRITGYEMLTSVDGLYRLQLNTEKQYSVRNLVVSGEDLELRVPSGSAFVAETEAGPTALVVLGTGEMRFTPAPPAERGQVRIFCGADALITPLTALYVRFNPSDFRFRASPEALTPVTVDPRELARAQAVFDEYIGNSFGLDLRDLSRENWSLVPGLGDFVAEIRTRKYQTLTYAQSSGEPEDISLFDRRRRRNISVYPSRSKLAQHGRFYNEDDLADYDIIDYDIEASFTPAREWIDARARVKLRARNYVVGTMTLKLHEGLSIRSVSSDRHGRLTALRVRGQNSFIINLPKALVRDDVITLRIVYAGHVPQLPTDREVVAPQQSRDQAMAEAPVVNPEERFVFSNRSFWYPQGNVTDFATARLRLSVPAPYNSVATGSPAPDNPRVVKAVRPGEPDRNVSEFLASQPVRYLAWTISRFEEAASTNLSIGRAAPLTGSNGTPRDAAAATAGGDENGARRQRVASLEGGDAYRLGVVYDGLDLDVVVNPRQVARGRGILRQVSDMFTFYSSIVDDLPYPNFTLTLVDNELPGGHSPAYFALVYQPLPTTPFVWRGDPVHFENFPQFFMAHELAHQFWGQAVGWKSYHDQWISEGFAQYFAALYAERFGSPTTLRDVLRRMRTTVLENEDQGPISLGYRLGHIRGESRVFRAIVYNKGALVLHMLRRTLGDAPFFAALKQLYWSSRFTKIGTDDVERVFEEVTGRPLEAFFEQWVYESRIPRVRWSWRQDVSTAATSDGAVAPGANAGSRVDLRFDQADAPPVDLPVTVTLTYADGSSDDALVLISGATFATTLTARGPIRSVEVNEDGAALARFDRR